MDAEQATAKINAAAHEYVQEGMSILPAVLGEKEAQLRDWPNLILGSEVVDDYFPHDELRNIVRINGTNSNGRGDIDLDRDEARRIAKYILPEDALRFGREGQIPGHVEVSFADTVPRTTRYDLPGEGQGRCVVELRAEGSQTLLPPSVYPEGDRCIWYEGEVIEAHSVTIAGYAQDIAVAALLLMHYPEEGTRHQFWLGAIGMLMKAKHPAERVRRIVEATTRCAGDRERETRLRIIDTTMSKMMMGERIGGIKKLRSVAPEVPAILKKWLGKIADSGLPHVICNDRPLRDVSDEATDALVAANDPPEIFSRSGLLVRMAQDSEGRPVIQDINKDRLRYRMTRTAEFLRQGEETSHIFPPEAVVSDVLAAKAFSFPELVGLTQSPVLRPSGSILDKPGYDPETHLMYIPEDEKFEVSVPFEPTEEDVERSVALLKELYTDFPFVDDSSFANMLALTLTPVVRPAYRGPTPLAVIDKPAAGTGASLLTEVVCGIATAQPAAMMSPPDNDEETRKQITSVLRTGRPIVVVDNLGSELKNPSWARMLTSTLWEDRILGHSKVATLPQRSIWIATGNNVRLGGDLPRRCYWVRMDAKLAKPWDRPVDSFRHPDLLGWVADNRGELLGALLTLTRNWFAAGRPRWTGRPPGSFEEWARTVGGILEFSGIHGFLGNTDEMLDRTASTANEWEPFLGAWRESYGDRSLTAKDLVTELHRDEENPLHEMLPAELAVTFAEYTSGVYPENGSALSPMLSRKFGEAFSEKDGVRYGERGLYVTKAGQNRNKVALWRVNETGPSGGERQVRGHGVTRDQPDPTPKNSEHSKQRDTTELQTDTKIRHFPSLGPDDPATPQ